MKKLLLLCALAAAADTLTLIAVGDVMFGHKGTALLDAQGVQYPLKQLKEELSKADLRFCNLESPIADSGTPFEKTYTFKIPFRHAGLLTEGGFDVVNLANNHILDNGEAALLSTFRMLDSLGIKHIGAGKNLAEARRAAVVEKKGLKIGFLGYSLTFPPEFWADSARAGTPFGKEEFLREDIPALRPLVDYLFVSFHWGEEKRTTPKDYQLALGRLSIDLGADAVLGHHPHVLQSMELYKGKLIAYSLGNFCFATWTNAVWDSAILKLFFADKKFIRAEVTPILVNNFQVELQPRPLRGPEAFKSLTALAALCDTVGTRLSIDGERGWIAP